MPQFSQIASSPVGTFAVLALAAYLEVQGDGCFQLGLYRSSGSEADWLVCYRDGGARLLQLVPEFLQDRFRQASGYLCGALLLRCPDRSEAAISSVTQQAHLRRGSVHSDWRFNHDALEGLAHFGSVPQRQRPRSFDISVPRPVQLLN